jgi:hypothetical protein
MGFAGRAVSRWHAGWGEVGEEGRHIRSCNARRFTDCDHSNICHAEENICEAARENLAVACEKAGSYRSGETCFPFEAPCCRASRGVPSGASIRAKPRRAASR